MKRKPKVVHFTFLDTPRKVKIYCGAPRRLASYSADRRRVTCPDCESQIKDRVKYLSSMLAYYSRGS